MSKIADTACKQFRGGLAFMSKQAKKEGVSGECPAGPHWLHPGDVVQMFDAMHQACAENTGENCESRAGTNGGHVEAYAAEMRKALSALPALG